MHNRSLAELAAALRAKECSSVELTRHFLKRIRRLDERLNSFITVTEESALAAAAEADRRRHEGDTTPLTGLPIAHKDIFCTEGTKTSCGSKMLDNFIAPYDAACVTKLKAVGAVMLGKTNMDEFAMGSSNETSYYGPVHNPWDTAAVPGGSSGGSAAAVAARLTPGATGTDTGGSIRQPAALCGITGIKPTYGRVSRYGMIAFASSLDQGGPMARSAEDCALLLGAMAGFDARDSTSVEQAVPDYSATLNNSITGLKIGLPKEYFSGGLDGEVAKIIDAAIQELRTLGAEVKEVSLRNSQLAVPTYYVARQVGGGLRRRHYINDAYYLKAQQLRQLISQDFKQAFAEVDVIMGPTTPTAAFNLGEKVDDPVTMYLSDIYTIAANLAGLPGMSVPAGFIGKRPVGLQLIGNYFDEARLLNVAHSFQRATDWHTRCPEGFQ
ncbi:MAG: amidase family protein [Gammaproteobacteria bacterium]